MDKISYILYILRGVEPYGFETADILRIIENKLYDETYINSIADLLKNAINTVTDEKLRSNFEAAFDHISRMREQELREREISKGEATAELDILLN